jgi:hypothetical protein
MVRALWRLRQEDVKFKASLGYVVRPHLKKQKRKTKLKNVWIRIQVFSFPGKNLEAPSAFAPPFWPQLAGTRQELFPFHNCGLFYLPCSTLSCHHKGPINICVCDLPL